jgi:hypothetical protein
LATLQHSLFTELAPQASGQTGFSVATDVNFHVVGSPTADVGDVNGAGVVRVFNATTGALVTTLVDPSPGAGDQFGRSVAVSGNTVVVGAPFDDTGATDSGRAYVFNATTGALLTTLSNPAPAAGDNFGSSVAISGNTIVVGAEGDETDTFVPGLILATGSAFIFNASTGALNATLEPDNLFLASGQRFGHSVAVSGNSVVVGAYQDNGANLFGGTARVYNATTGAWLDTIINPTPAVGDQFGFSVAISGNTIVVGAPGDNAFDGRAYVFDATTGSTTSTLVNPSPAAGDQFGSSVGVSGNTAVVGAPTDDTGATDAGRAYLFNATTGGVLANIANPTVGAGDVFGSAVAISGSRAVVGARADDTGVANAGRAYVFSATTGALTTTLDNLRRPLPSGEQFGTSVAVSGNIVAVGAYLDSTGNPNNGRAYLYNAATGAFLTALNDPAPT